MWLIYFNFCAIYIGSVYLIVTNFNLHTSKNETGLDVLRVQHNKKCDQ